MGDTAPADRDAGREGQDFSDGLGAGADDAGVGDARGDQRSAGRRIVEAAIGPLR